MVYDARAGAIVRSEILHAIISHRSGGTPMTLEAGVVRIADALDMARGRSRIPFEKGSQSIHSISAAAIESVSIEAGRHQAGASLCQYDQLGGCLPTRPPLSRKVQGQRSRRLRRARSLRRRGGTEKSLVRTFRL